MTTQKTQFDAHTKCLKSLRPFTIHRSLAVTYAIDFYEVNEVAIRIDYSKQVAVVHDIHATHIEDRRLVFNIPSKAFRQYVAQILKEDETTEVVKETPIPATKIDKLVARITKSFSDESFQVSHDGDYYKTSIEVLHKPSQQLLFTKVNTDTAVVSKWQVIDNTGDLVREGKGITKFLSAL